MPATQTPAGERNSSWFEDLVILLTLVSFAVAQTVYDILSSNPELLAARRVTNAQLLAVIAVFGLLPAIAIAAAWSLSRLLSPSVHRAIFGALVAAFSLTLFWQARNTYLGEGGGLLYSPWLWIAPSLVLALLAWRNQRGFRSFLLALSPAILIFPALFLYRTWRSPITPPEVVVSAEASTEPAALISPNGTPVFFLVFDELGLHVLLDEEGRIDAASYPNFARLAGQSHWFRNATSNSPKTITAIATLVTGNLPRGGDSNHANYPNTIFSLLAPPYQVYIEEVGYTNFCDSEAFQCLNDATGDATAGLLRDIGYLLAARVLPAKLDFGLPDTSHTWGPFQSAEEWTHAALARARRVLHAVDALGRTNVLFFAHLILPHSPYTLTPDGEVYSLGPYALDDGQDTAILASLTERYRRQVRYVDGWLGQFLDRLRRRGLYDPALLIVTGDHGVSWKPEAPGRTLREENAELMLSVPLFVKLPFQTEGQYSEQDVQHIDLAPTIAEVLGAAVPFPTAGRSVFTAGPGPRPKVAYGDAMARFEFDDRLAMRPVETQPRRSALVGQKIEDFQIIPAESVRGRLEAMQFAPPGTPDFAADLPILVSGWALEVHPEATAIETDPGSARSGELGLAVHGREAGARQRLTGLVPGGRYMARAWARSRSGTGAPAVLRVTKPDGEILASAEGTPGGEFVPLQFDFLAPEGGEARLELHSQGSGPVDWDDVELIEIAAQPAGEPLRAISRPDLIVNGGFEEPLAEPWVVYGEDPGPPSQSFEVAVTVNGEIVGATQPGAERWDVATKLLSPRHGYLKCGWTVSVSDENLHEGENPVEAYVILDAARRIAVRLDSGHPRALIKNGASIDRKAP